jgi:hypothetical protein
MVGIVIAWLSALGLLFYFHPRTVKQLGVT